MIVYQSKYKNNASTYIPGAILVKKRFLSILLLKVQSCRYFSDLFIILDGKHKFQQF